MTRDWLYSLDPEQLLARLIWGEARGETVEGQVAVACVARNRWTRPRWWGHSPHDVMLKKAQFSCFNENDPNFHLLEKPWEHAGAHTWEQCLWVAEGVLGDRAIDNTEGADHYVTVWLLKRLQASGSAEHWAFSKEPTGRVGNHVFFRLET